MNSLSGSMLWEGTNQGCSVRPFRSPDQRMLGSQTHGDCLVFGKPAKLNAQIAIVKRVFASVVFASVTMGTYTAKSTSKFEKGFTL